MIKILGGIVISVFLAECRHQASRVTSVCRSLTVAYLSPEVLAALTTATTEEEVVIDLVVCCCFGAVEYGGRGAFKTDDDGAIRSVGEDMSA